MTADKGLVLCKLGGSVITDKAQPETMRYDVLERLGRELAHSLTARPELRLILGHGSGSFGHMVAGRHGTRDGVHDRRDWFGFARVAASAARLNRLVTDTLLEAGIPVWSLQPSVSATCRAGELQSLALTPVRGALENGLVPLLYGDVALDDSQGGTIISTEQIFSYVARRLRPSRIVLVAESDGVFEDDPICVPGAPSVPLVTHQNWSAVRAGLGGSYATDVTGGMLTKVETMLSLVSELKGLEVHIVSGMRPGALERAILREDGPARGTIIRYE